MRKEGSGLSHRYEEMSTVLKNIRVGPVSSDFETEESQELAWARMLNPAVDLINAKIE